MKCIRQIGIDTFTAFDSKKDHKILYIRVGSTEDLLSKGRTEFVTFEYDLTGDLNEVDKQLRKDMESEINPYKFIET